MINSLATSPRFGRLAHEYGKKNSDYDNTERKDSLCAA